MNQVSELALPFVLVFSWAASSTAVEGDACSPAVLALDLREVPFVEIRAVKELPEQLMKDFWRSTPALPPLAFANPNEEFQATDVLGGRRLPWRRLILGGRSPRITYIYYEKGGRGLSRHAFIACSQPGVTRLFSYLLPPETKGISNLFGTVRAECLVAPPTEAPTRDQLDACSR